LRPTSKSRLWALERNGFVKHVDISIPFEYSIFSRHIISIYIINKFEYKRTMPVAMLS